MQRVTITIDDDLLSFVDSLTEKRGYDSRSEALRDIVREAANRETIEAGGSQAIAALTYVFDSDTRELAHRLARAQHDHHDIVAANLRIPLDHNACVDLSVLKGNADAVRRFADTVTTQRGVRHANLHIIPVKVSANRHRHDDDSQPHLHLEA